MTSNPAAPTGPSSSPVNGFHAMLVEQANVAVLAVDAAETFTVFNTEAERKLGVARERIRTLDDLRGLGLTRADGSSLPFEEMPLVRAARGESLADCVIYTSGSDGERRALAGAATVLRDGSGGFAGAALYLRDVTARDRNDADRGRLLREVEESRRRYRQLAQSFPGAVLMYDHHLRFVLVDGPVLERIGFPAQGLEGKLLSEVVPPERLPALEPHYLAALSGQVVEREVVAGDVIFSVQHHPVRDEAGAIVAGMVLALDITTRRHAEAAARKAEQRMQRIAASPMMGVLFTKFDGRVTYANDTFLKMIGYTREDLEAGRIDWRALTPPEWQEVSLDAVKQMEANGFATPFAKEYVAKDGSRVPVVVGSTRVPEHEENVTFVLDARDRHSAAETLRKQTRVLDTIMENASLGLVMMDAQQRCTFMNPAAERVFGLTLAEVKAFDKPLHDIIHHTRPDGSHYPMEECPIDRALPTRMREKGEDMFVRPDGSLYPVAFTASPILEGGVPIGTVIEVRDTTQEKAAEGRLRQQTETLEILNRVGQQLQSELDLDKLVHTITEAATQLTGAQFGALFYNVTDDRGETYALYAVAGVPREAFSKFPLPRNTKVFAPTFAGEGIVRVDDIRVDPRYGHNEPHFGMPKGHLPVASYLAVPVISRSGKVLGGLFFGHERVGVFTEHAEQIVAGLASQAAVAMDNAALYRGQQQAARAAEFERKRLRTLLEQLPGGVAVSYGPDHLFDWSNPLYVKIAGREVSGKTVREAFPELATSPIFDLLDRVYQTAEPFFGNEMLVPLDRNGTGTTEPAYFDFVYQPIVDEHGKSEGILTVCSEVTKSVTARQRVEVMAADLSRAVAEERRAATEREQLIAQLEKTNRELDQFAYVASHDLKAPLRGIANLSQWIEEDLTDHMTDDSREQMRLLRGRVFRLEELINGILRYSRAGRVKDAAQTIATSDLFRGAWDLLTPPATATLVVAEGMPVLVAERVPLEQIAQNLLSNALKHGGPNTTVQISATPREHHWEFAVQDNGPGIAPEYHERIWEIFQTLAPRDEVESTGIGLSVVRKIVEGKGGRAWVESTPGQGATFHFTWPRSADAAS